MTKKEFLLVFKNTKLSDLTPDKLFYEKFTESVEVFNEEKNYNVMPTKFSSFEKWVKSTDLKCWECVEVFFTTPLFIPVNPCSVSTTNTVYDTHGIFCSYPCICRYINSNYDEQKKPDIMMEVKNLYFMQTGRRVHKLAVAPPKTIMKQFCGNFGINSEEYKKILQDCESQYLFY